MTDEYGPAFYDALMADYPHLQRAILGCLALHGVPQRYIDVGSGCGATVDTLSRLLGEDRSTGYEQAAFFGWAEQRPGGPPAGTYISINLARTRFTPGVEGPADLVTCWEVAEHLPEASADRFVESLASLVAPGGRLVFTAAAPGQPGHGHINCQPKAYWIEKLSLAGLGCEAQWTIWQETVWDHTVNPLLWLRDNCIVFSKPEA